MCLDDVLARQAGVVSRAQALATGMSADEVDRRVARRCWRPLHPRVYLADRGGPADEVRVRAAVLWAGEGAVLAGIAAAWWLGLPVRMPATVAVTVPRRRSPGHRPGIAVGRRTLPVPDLFEYRGLPVTAPPLTTLEAALALGAAGGEFLEAALHGSVSLDDVGAASGRAGGTGERLLAEAAQRARTTARLRVAGMLRRAGIPARVTRPGHGDAIVCPTARLAVCPTARLAVCPTARPSIGWTAPDAPADLPAGWRVLHVSWRDLADHPDVVVADVRAALDGTGRAWITG